MGPAAGIAAGPTPVSIPFLRWYRFGDAILALRSNDRSFSDRFSLLFGGCAVGGPSAGLSVIDGVVEVDGIRGQARVTVEGGELADPEALVLAVFSDDGVTPVSERPDGWRELATRGDPSWRMDVRGNEVVARSGAPWQYVAGAVLVHRAMAAQPDVTFVHAAGVEIGGEAVLFVGPREAGKTTVAVGLAARGHRFLGDEVGAIRLDGPAVLSFPRAAGVRPGPRSRASSALVDRPDLPVEQFADGSRKTLLPSRHLGSVPPGETIPFGHVVVLEGRAATPRLDDLEASPGNVRYLAPVKSMPFSAGSGLKTLKLLRAASAVRWHRLRAGTPDDTITLIERRLATT